MSYLQSKPQRPANFPWMVWIWLLLGAESTAIGQQAPPLSRFIPSKNLAIHVECEGVGAHKQVWRASAAYKLLNETSLGELVKALAAQGFEAGRERKTPSGTEIVDVVERLGTQGFAIGISGDGPLMKRFVLAIRGGARPEYRELIDKLISANVLPENAVKTVRKGNRSITEYGGGEEILCLWDDQGDLVLCPSEFLEPVLATLDGKAPNVATNPLRSEMFKPDPDFHSIGVAFVDIKALSNPPPDLKKVGLEGVKRVELRFGFQNDALMTDLRVIAPAPRQGLVSLFDSPGFNLAGLPPIPAGTTNFTALTLDPVKTFDRLPAMFNDADPTDSDKYAGAVKEEYEALKIEIRRDLLPHLGPEVVMYDRPKPDVQGVKFPFVNAVISIQIDDEAAIRKELVSLIPLVNRLFFKRVVGADGLSAEFKKLNEARTIYQLGLDASLRPATPLNQFSPVIIVGKSRLILAANLEVGRKALDLAEGIGERWKPDGPLITLPTQLPGAMNLLIVNDPRDTFPQIVSGLPVILESMNTTTTHPVPIAVRRGNVVAPRNSLPITIDNALVPSPEELEKRLFPGSLALSTSDQGLRIVIRESIPNFTSPAAMGAVAFALFPSWRASLDVDRRSACTMHLKQIGLAMHNFHSANDAFPKAAITDKQGKPLLSWRVAILPYLGNQALYNKFRLEEAWDSPHNLALLKEMPTVYTCPSSPKNENFKTSYQAFVGKGAILEPTQSVGIAQITDGTSNTIMVVESKAGVPWTKPDDLKFDPEAKVRLNGAGSDHSGGLHVLFADGSVQFIKSTIRSETWRALITKAGGEVIDRSAIP